MAARRQGKWRRRPHRLARLRVGAHGRYVLALSRAGIMPNLAPAPGYAPRIAPRAAAHRVAKTVREHHRAQIARSHALSLARTHSRSHALSLARTHSRSLAISSHARTYAPQPQQPQQQPPASYAATVSGLENLKRGGKKAAMVVMKCRRHTGLCGATGRCTHRLRVGSRKKVTPTHELVMMIVQAQRPVARRDAAGR